MIDELFKEQAEYSYALHGSALQLEKAFINAGLLDRVETFLTDAADEKTLKAAFNITYHLLTYVGVSKSPVEEKIYKASVRLIRYQILLVAAYRCSFRKLDITSATLSLKRRIVLRQSMKPIMRSNS
jgi:lipopolysaccharide biosynthesis regulator YciM